MQRWPARGLARVIHATPEVFGDGVAWLGGADAGVVGVRCRIAWRRGRPAWGGGLAGAGRLGLAGAGQRGWPARGCGAWPALGGGSWPTLGGGGWHRLVVGVGRRGCGGDVGL